MTGYCVHFARFLPSGGSHNTGAAAGVHLFAEPVPVFTCVRI
jgi:hypothetical protein